MSKRPNNALLLTAAGIAAVLILSKSDKEQPQKKMTGALTGKPTDFIIKMTPYAKAATKLFPQVPYELVLAFSGLESGWGKNAPGFNFFGTKPGSAWKGKTQQFDTTEYLKKSSGYNFPKVYSVTPAGDKFKWKVRDTFRAFDNPAEAFVDFCKFITGGRYKGA